MVGLDEGQYSLAFQSGDLTEAARPFMLEPNVFEETMIWGTLTGIEINAVAAPKPMHYIAHGLYQSGLAGYKYIDVVGQYDTPKIGPGIFVSQTPAKYSVEPFSHLINVVGAEGHLPFPVGVLGATSHLVPIEDTEKCNKELAFAS